MVQVGGRCPVARGATRLIREVTAGLRFQRGPQEIENSAVPREDRMIPFSRGTALVPVGVERSPSPSGGYAASSRSRSLSTVFGPRPIHPIWIANVRAPSTAAIMDRRAPTSSGVFMSACLSPWRFVRTSTRL